MQNTLNIDTYLAKVVDRLSNQIKDRYNVDFNFFTPLEWKNREISNQIPISNSSKPIQVSIVVNDNDTYLPVTSSGELVGVVWLQNSAHLSAQQLSLISELVDAMIGGSLELTNRLENLEAHISYQESHLNFQDPLQNSHLPSNVVSMDKFSYLRKSKSGQTLYPNHVMENLILDLPIFIHARTKDQIWRLGHEIYTYTQKLACLNLKDICNAQEDLTFDFLTELGPVCLVIPEIKDLSQESLDVLMEFILAQKKNSTDTLLLIFGSTSSAAELIKSNKISLNFYRLISQAQLSHQEDTLSQDQLSDHIRSLIRSQKDLKILTLLSELSAFRVDDMV